MKVKQLIELLQTYNEDAEVIKEREEWQTSLNSNIL